MLGSLSTCFMLRFMMRANLKLCSSSFILFHRLRLMLTVILFGVCSIIVVISSLYVYLFSLAKVMNYFVTSKLLDEN